MLRIFTWSVKSTLTINYPGPASGGDPLRRLDMDGELAGNPEG